jgi:hypothetical protein
MKGVDLYGLVRYAVQIEGLSRREAGRQFGIDPRTVAKMIAFSVPPGYRRSKLPARPKLDPSSGLSIGSWRRIRAVRRSSGTPRSGSSSVCGTSTALRGGLTIVKDYVHDRRLRQRTA